MKKTDIGVVGFMYSVCILFFALSSDLKRESQIYPRLIIVLLFSLTTFYAIQMVIAARRVGVVSGVEEVFDGFLPRQFFSVTIMIFAYLALMYLTGFYISTVIFVVACLWYLKVPKLHILVSTPAIIGLIYGSFTLFLGVKLPIGLLLR